MGGNGAYSSFLSYSLDTYEKDRYKCVGMIGTAKVITVVTQRNDKAPMNAFSSSMYYVTKPNDPNKITTITFYDARTHGIKKSIDLKYDKEGNLLSFGEKGTHVHKWSKNGKGEYGRVTHDKSDIFEPTRTDWIYIKRALKYNSSHASAGK